MAQFLVISGPTAQWFLAERPTMGDVTPFAVEVSHGHPFAIVSADVSADLASAVDDLVMAASRY